MNRILLVLEITLFLVFTKQLETALYYLPIHNATFDSDSRPTNYALYYKHNPINDHENTKRNITYNTNIENNLDTYTSNTNLLSVIIPVETSINTIHDYLRKDNISNSRIVYGTILRPVQFNKTYNNIPATIYKTQQSNNYTNIPRNGSQLNSNCEYGCNDLNKPFERRQQNNTFLIENKNQLRHGTNSLIESNFYMNDSNSVINNSNSWKKGKYRTYKYINMNGNDMQNNKNYNRLKHVRPKNEHPYGIDYKYSIYNSTNIDHYDDNIKSSSEHEKYRYYEYNEYPEYIYDGWDSDNEHHSSHSWRYIKEIHFCSKYCHCCKKENHFKNIKFGFLGKLLYFFKYFGFNHGYGLIESHSFNKYNPFSYFRNLYHTFNDYSDYDYQFDELNYDESFVHFDEDHGEPDDVMECKELCSCCKQDLVIKFKKQLHSFKLEHYQRRKLQNFFRFLRSFIFSEEDSDDHEYERSFHNHDTIDHYDYHDGYNFYEDDVSHWSHPDTYHHDHEITDHHTYIFDCSKCCKFCKTSTFKIVEERNKKKRRKGKRRRKPRRGIKNFIKRLFGGNLFGMGSENDSDDDNEPPDYEDEGENKNQTCCNHFSGVKVIIILVVVAIIIVQGFSSINLLVIAIIPIIIFGVIVILIFLLLQAAIPIYFIPIIAIVLLAILAPVLIIAVLFFLMLPIILLPIFFPFILHMQEGMYFPNMSTSTSLPTTIMVETTPLYTEPYETTTMPGDVTTIKTNAKGITVIEMPLPREAQNEMLDNIFSKENSKFGSKYCLERVGCHLAVITQVFSIYNSFILRILENLSMKTGRRKFMTYKEAYKTGSFRETNHNKCASLYYCKAIDFWIVNK